MDFSPEYNDKLFIVQNVNSVSKNDITEKKISHDLQAGNRLKKVLTEFSNSTTIHGCRFIGESNSSSLKR